VVEDTVDEGRRVLAAEAAADLDRLVDGDRGGDVGPREELEGGEAQEVQVDAREPRQPPVLGALGDERVDPRLFRTHALHELAREALHLVAALEVRPEEREAALAVPLLGRIELVERLQRQLACLASDPHVSA
jgi:hypothetical protein